MKTITFKVDNEDYAKLAEVADVLECSVEEFMANEAVYFLAEIFEGSVADNLASRIWDTLEEARRAAEKADALDGMENDWRFYRRPDGRVSSECSSHLHANRISEGCVLI